MSDDTRHQDDREFEAGDPWAYHRAVAALVLLLMSILSAFVAGTLIAGIGWGFAGLSVGTLVAALLIGSD
jgi:hypothetical protein